MDEIKFWRIEQVNIETYKRLVPDCRFFLTREGRPLAAMVYFAVSEKIVQCIYSGYLLDYSNSDVMNYLTWYSLQYFGEKGIPIY